MKTTILTLLMTFTFASVFSQEKEEEKKATVTKTVSDAFKRDYPSINKVEWEEEDGNFEGEFKLDGKETSAVYDDNGNRLEVEQEVPMSEVPTEAAGYVTKNYPAYKVNECEKITNSKGVISFEVELKKGKEELDIIFDNKGKFVSK